MHVRDHGVQGKNQFLAAIEELDQEEVQLEDMLSVYLKTSTENHPTADIDKGKPNTYGLTIPFPFSSLIRKLWSSEMLHHVIR
jgi:hypothetical protein